MKAQKYNLEMHSSYLLMSKMFFLLLILQNFSAKINDPFLPFIKTLNVFNQFPHLFSTLIHVLFWCAGLLLIFNYKARFASFILGCTVIITIIASKPMYSNHTLIVGCGFIVAGLSNMAIKNLFLRIQLAIIYFGALFNKILDPDWRNGQFMEFWMSSTNNPFYQFFGTYFPENVISLILSYSTIVIEASIFILLILPNRKVIAVWTILLFHLLLFTTTGMRFGYFIEAIFILLIGLKHVDINQNQFNDTMLNAFYSSRYLIILLFLDFIIVQLTPFKINYLLSVTISWSLVGSYLFLIKKEKRLNFS